MLVGIWKKLVGSVGGSIKLGNCGEGVAAGKGARFGDGGFG